MASFTASAVSSTLMGFDEAKSFYDQIMKLSSRHKEFMNEKLRYKVYVHSPFVDHHCLVLAEKEGRCEHVTFELTIAESIDGEGFQVAPKAQLYTGELTGLNYKGEVCSSLEHLCEVAYRVLVDMGSYNLAFNNCQHFCDKLLKELDLSGHTTDTTKIGISATLFAAGVGVLAGAYGLYKFISNDEGKEKKKNTK